MEATKDVITPQPSSVSAESSPPPQPARQRLVFTDPVAFRYLEEDESTSVLERRRELTGYEIYIVEQWACSRVHPSFVITTYTGLPQHVVLVDVLSVPTDEQAWSPRLRVYLRAIHEYHARKKETPLGTLMVTNLSGFPSALTVIAVPGGDVRRHRKDFFVNENLKRLGCSGRAGMNLSAPSGATQTKFKHLYRTSDRVPFFNAVMELITLCQVALVLFAKLAPEYADGLLCDVTEQAISDWWTEIGINYFNVEPTDGKLGPTTVAALLGMLIGARNRLNAHGAPIAKDVFDLRSTKRAIAHFQKSQKLTKSRRLDRQTLDRLHRLTLKAASGEGWTVPKAVKSTVAELSGKGGEMVMEMVGASEKAGIAEVETLDIEKFVKLASGGHCKWLWHGKQSKHNHGDLFSNMIGEDDMIFGGDDMGGYVWSSRKRDSVADDSQGANNSLNKFYNRPNLGANIGIESLDRDTVPRKTVFKSVAGKMSDARSGLGRIKDAVGRRGHHKYPSKDGDTGIRILDSRNEHLKDGKNQVDVVAPSSKMDPDVPSEYAVEAYSGSDPNSPVYGGGFNERDFEKNTSEKSPMRARASSSAGSDSIQDMQDDSDEDPQENSLRAISSPEKSPDLPIKDRFVLSMDDPRNEAVKNASQTPYMLPRPFVVQSTQSLSQVPTLSEPFPHKTVWPRHLSFSTVEDILRREEKHDVKGLAGNALGQENYPTIANERYQMLMAHNLTRQLEQMQTRVTSWVTQKVRDVEELDGHASKDEEDLNLMYDQKLEAYNALNEASKELVSEEKASLFEALKDLEVLGAKMEYELSTLRLKVMDVEDGVADFERQVSIIEARGDELNDEHPVEGQWLHWFLKFLFGIH